MGKSQMGEQHYAGWKRDSRDPNAIAKKPVKTSFHQLRCSPE
jgi:hypothetical protein